MSSPAPAAGAVRPSHALFALALSMLLGLQPATTDIYLPALPLLTRELAAPMGAVQLTMSAMILSFGIAQLVWGPVADRIGRRPVLITGLVVYTVASVGSAMAPHIEALVAWRVLQGATLAASVVCARAMLRDLYEPHEGAQVMALGLSGLGAVAIAGPIVGGLVAANWGWRAALAVVAMCGALTLAFVVWRLPETLPRERRQPAGIGRLGSDWAGIVRHPTFIAWTLLVSASYGTLFLLLASSSFVYMDVLGLSAAAYGVTMAAGSTSYLAGTVVCRRLIRRHGLAGAVRRGGVFTLAGGLGMLAAATVERPALWMLLVPHLLFSFGHGIHQPCAQAGAVGPFPRTAGAASALTGFLLALAAFVVGLWLGRAIDGTARPLTLGIGCGAIVISLVAWTLVQRHALAPAARPT